MKNIIGILLMTLVGCASKWQVVQKINVNMYHLQNPRTKEVKVIISRDELLEGQIINKHRLNVIAEIEK